MAATKKELEELAKDLYKRLGGVRTKDGRIVRALLVVWKAAELNAAQQSAQADRICPLCKQELSMHGVCLNEACDS